MNTPDVIWEGRVSDGILPAIIEALKKLFGRKGRLLWVDVD
jgi:hypothetical protein